MGMPLTDEVTFQEYVYQDFEAQHSGVLSPLLYLNPANQCKEMKRYECFHLLERYLSESITVYRAFEWWANQPDYMPFQPIKERAAHLLESTVKPTSFMTMTALRVEV